MLFALALSPHGLSSNYTQARFGLPEGGAAGDARDALVRRGEVLSDPYRITDPLLSHWLRQRRRPPGPDRRASFAPCRVALSRQPYMRRLPTETQLL